MSKITTTIGNVANATVNCAINITAGVAGGTVMAYAINHDVANDEDASLILGIGGGVGTACLVRSALYGVKNATIGVSKKIGTAINKKSKKGSTT